MTHDIYVAAPFFCEAENSFNDRLVTALESVSLKVFYPRRDGLIAKSAVANGGDLNKTLEAVWRRDTNAIANARIIVAVLDGRTVDEGVCVEVGYASALGKCIIGFYSDERCFMPWGLNPMVRQPVSSFSTTIEGVLKAALGVLQT